MSWWPGNKQAASSQQFRVSVLLYSANFLSHLSLGTAVMSAVPLSSLLALACSCLLKFSLPFQATCSTSGYAFLRTYIACFLTSPCELPAKSLCLLETSGTLTPCPSSPSTPPRKSCSFSMCSWPLWYWNLPYGGVHFTNLPPLLLGLNSFLRFRFNKNLTANSLVSVQINGQRWHTWVPNSCRL